MYLNKIIIVNEKQRIKILKQWKTRTARNLGYSLI